MALLDELPDEMIVSMLEDGKSQTQICYELGIGRRALEQWIDDNDPNIITRARAKAADKLAVETLSIADGMDIDHAQRDVQRIRTRQWLAERWDQKTYGLQKAQQININLQDLRMAALRHVEVVDDLSTGEKA
jgi:DNA-binding NarL/FixJ family response regulator